MYGNARIIESHAMLEDGEPYEVPRTWKERLTQMPWRPFCKTRTVVPKVPASYSYRLPSGDWVMHPVMAERFRLAARQDPF